MLKNKRTTFLNYSQNQKICLKIMVRIDSMINILVPLKYKTQDC